MAARQRFSQEQILWIAKQSGGNRRLAKALAEGGFKDFDDAVDAVLEASKKYEEREGPVMITSFLLANRRRSWLVALLDEHIYAFVSRTPTREPEVTSRINRATTARWCNEARELIQPAISHLKKKRFRNASSARTSLNELYPLVVNRLTSAKLLEEILPPCSLPSPASLAFKLVSKEHPEVGTATTLQRNLHRRAPKRVVD